MKALFVMLGLAPCAMSTAQAQFFNMGKPSPLEFYDVDYSALADPSQRVTFFDDMHYIPLPMGPDSYLSLGGEFRQQFWSQNNEAHGLRSPKRNTYDLQRIVGDVYLHLDKHIAIFAQIGRYDSFGKISPSTTDESYGRIQQGFVEVKEAVGPADVTARVGRQEIALGSTRFVWVSDSANVRTAQDGVRVHANMENISLDLVAARPVNSTLDPFSDWDTHAGIFGAAYLSEAVLQDKLHVDEYYYFRRNIAAQYAGLTGNEDRNTIGGRLWGTIGSFKYDSDFAYQFGTFDNKSISAFGMSTRVLYTFENVSLKPGLQMQVSYFSGSNNGPNSGSIGTFSAPLPRPTFLNYVGIETLENLIEAYPAVILNPTSDVALRFGPEVLWRASAHDAVYISRTTPLPKTLSAQDTASYIGTNLAATLQWSVAPHITVFAEYLHELPGPAITLAGGKATDAGVAMIDFNF